MYDQSNSQSTWLTDKKMVEFDELLIYAVKEYPCLFNTKSNDFKVTWKKENAWKAVSKQLNSTGK